MSRYISGADTTGSDNINIDNELVGKTEWDDILMKHGIKERPAKQLTEDEITSAIAEAKQEQERDAQHNPLKNRSLDDDDVSDMEDELDERLLQEYRQQRVKQLKEQQSKSKYGTLLHITEAEYKTEVTDSSISASDDASSSSRAVVICILFAYSDPSSQLLLSLVERLAAKHPQQKFVKIEATKAIPNYPTSSCPTILVYRDTHIVKQYVGLDEFGGIKSNLQCVEYVLGKDGYLNNIDMDDYREDPRLKVLGRTKLNVANKSGIRSKRNNDDDDSDDD